MGVWQRGGVEIRTDRRVTIDARCEQVWDDLVAIDRYPARWPWLRELEWHGGFDAGARCRCRVRSPWGYAVGVVVTLDRVESGELVEATVDGDVGGTARLSLVPRHGGGGVDRTEVRLQTVLRPQRRLLRVLTALAPPAARLGHDRIVRSGMERFAADVGRP